MMHTILTIIALLIVLGVVVFIHEAGHFLAARWAGVRVNAFSIGFGPAIVKWKDKHNTVWKLCCLPLGGYVSIYGQEDMFDRKKYAALPKAKKIGHYLSVPAWTQFIIIAAGVFMNFMLAWTIYSADFMFRSRTVQLPVIGQVVRESV
ncbi:MAG: site-2 protease family protein, partial [Alphaproteobacteria bacterium]|nr:site-2 protease family protein [Alphaproteobacteria bacterium]